MAEEPDAEQTTVKSDEVVRAMVDQHGSAVYRLAVSIVRDPALAEDVAQETFIKAWRHRDTFRGAAPVRHWLLRIAHNVAVSTLRGLREEARDPSTLPGRHGDLVESVVANRMAVKEALARLDPLSRSIVVLREMEGLNYAEISEVLGVALPTVKTRLFRARATLRALTGEDGP
ncbi:RNA polymerase sigma factor [Micromonospora sp. NPDC047740]|uniref:RNA polymerase sigma factor n=1 Tax=Micromonospora sp. NPDC047740 TaxID=3364254 RepID=UPI0037166B53